MKPQLFQQFVPTGTNNPEPEAEGQLELGRVFAALQRRKWVIVGVTLAVTTLAGVRAYLSPPTYKSSFSILIQPSSAETEVISSVTGLPTNPTETTVSLADRVRILSSPGVLKPAVEKVLATYPDICPASSFVGSDQLTPEEQRQKCGYNLLSSRLNVQLGKDSRIAEATYSSESRSLARYVAEVISQTYLDYGLEVRQQDIRQALDFLDVKLPDVRDQVDQLQAQMEKLRQDNNLISPEARSSQLNQQVSDFRQQYLAVRIELEQTLTLAEDLHSQLQNQPQDAAASPYLSDNSRYQALVKDLLALDSKIAAASTLYLDNSPDMQVLQEQRQNLLTLLAREGKQTERELLSTLDGLQSREQALANTLASLDVDVDDLASISRQYTDLDRELKIATENLDQLLSKKESLLIEAAQRELPWELITPPEVSTQVASLPTNLLLGGLLGLLLGVGLALTLDNLRDAIYTPGDLKRVTPLPILGLIPFHEEFIYELEPEDMPVLATVSEASMPTVDTPADGGAYTNSHYSNGSTPPSDSTAFREAFRSLMANIRRIESDSETPIRSVVISSAEDGEGKSTIAAFLAQAAAAMGERVLLVDGDLRSPHIHELLGTTNTMGWADWLSGKRKLRSVIQQSTFEPNLYLLPAGAIPADPTRLLSGKPIKQFITQVSPAFDLIIFDTPSVLQYADAPLIAAETNGMILASNLGKLKSSQLEQALEKLWISKINILGIAAREAAPQQFFQLV